jgi:hypothetical protein
VIPVSQKLEPVDPLGLMRVTRPRITMVSVAAVAASALLVALATDANASPPPSNGSDVDMNADGGL